jgi:hypothetical protein
MAAATMDNGRDMAIGIHGGDRKGGQRQNPFIAERNSAQRAQ